MYDKMIFELSHSKIDKTYYNEQVPAKNINDMLPAGLQRKEKIGLPEVAENEVMRHFITLSDKNHHVDKAFYPLG